MRHIPKDRNLTAPASSKWNFISDRTSGRIICRSSTPSVVHIGIIDAIANTVVPIGAIVAAIMVVPIGNIEVVIIVVFIGAIKVVVIVVTIRAIEVVVIVVFIRAI